jgi:pimeloyl-ACP methyl ester carboxylesterase
VKRRSPARRAAIVVSAVIAGLALGIAVDIVRVGGLDAWLALRGPTVPPTYDVPPYDARGRRIDVDGRPVYLDCRGAGSPTVILEAGFGAGADSWGYVLDGVAATTRVCAWDRPGIGRSAARGLHSAGETAVDLRAAVEAAGEGGPFVVVAHSLGGVYGRLFGGAGPPAGRAATERDAVLAFVMLDTYEPDLGMDRDPALSPAVRDAIRQSIADTGAAIQNGEQLDWAATLAQLEPIPRTELPTVLLTVDPKLRYTDPDPAVRAALIDAWYRAIADHYPNGRLEVVPNTGHLIHLERPSLVLEWIRRVVAEQRAASQRL